MSTLPKSSKKTYGFPTNRVEALSDGIFGVSLTLLVLDLKIPDIPQEFANQRLLKELLNLWPNFLIFIMTFILVAVVWVGHHIRFHYIKCCDRNFIWINNLLLMFIALVPFPSSLLGKYPDHQIAHLFYGVTMGIISISCTLTWWYAIHNRLLVEDINPDVVKRIMRLSILPIPIYLSSAVLSFVSVKISTIIYVILPIIYIFPNRLDKNWGARSLLGVLSHESQAEKDKQRPISITPRRRLP